MTMGATFYPATPALSPEPFGAMKQLTRITGTVGAAVVLWSAGVRLRNWVELGRIDPPDWGPALPDSNER